MSVTLDIPVGKAVAFGIQLTKDGRIFDMSGASSVKAVVVTADNKTKLSDVVTPTSGLSGADWANSFAVIQFLAADTEAIAQRGPAEIEILVTEGGFSTPFYVACRLVSTHV
mgnify:CR=1 FL=1